MTQEDKELLLKDLCARLPYLPIVEISIYRDNNRRSDIELDPHVTENIWELIDKYHAIPYLRPMSSMTEQERKELKTLFDAEEITSDSICYLEGGTLEEYLSHISYSFCSKIIDWLNANQFDYRGLIPKGLAIEVTKENNPYEDINI